MTENRVEYLTPAQVAERLGISYDKLLSLIRSGRIEHFRLGKRIVRIAWYSNENPPIRFVDPPKGRITL